MENLLKNELGFPVRQGIVKRLRRKTVSIPVKTGTKSKGIDEFQC
jgi:hypothetical protein